MGKKKQIAIKKEELTSHPFLIELIERAQLQSLVIASMEKSKKAGKRFWETSLEPLTEIQGYSLKIFDPMIRIVDFVQQLADIKKFIARFPTPHQYRKEGISWYKWLEYHYSHYEITIASLGDIALVLINAVFLLGNPEKLCTIDTITRNEHIINTPVLEIYKKIEKIIKPYRKRKNYYIHRGEPPALHYIFKSPFLIHLKLCSFLDSQGTEVVDKKIIDLWYRDEGRKICEELESRISEIKDSVWILFDRLFEVYNKFLATRFSP